MRFLFFLLVTWSVNCFCQTNSNKKSQNLISIKTFNTTNIGWGYDILRNGKLYVHQPNIPAVAGNAGFKTEVDAKKVAGLMKHKIEKNILPPTIDIKELDSLKIKYK